MDEPYIKELGDPEITERKLVNPKRFMLALFLGIVAIMVVLLPINLWNMEKTPATILAVIVLIIYAIILFFLTETKTLREVKTTDVKYVGKPVEVVRTIKERVPIVHTVEKPVIKKVVQKVPVIVKRKIPRGHRYKYVGSKEGGVYHLTTSRLSRLIRPKNRVYTDDYHKLEKIGLKPSAQIKRERAEAQRKATRKRKATKKKK